MQKAISEPKSVEMNNYEITSKDLAIPSSESGKQWPVHTSPTQPHLPLSVHSLGFLFGVYS